MGARDILKKIADLIRRVPGLEVVGEPQYVGPCVEIVARIDGEPIFIYIYEGRISGKPFARILARPMGCNEALVAPEGAYSFYLGDDEEFIKSIASKARLALAQNSSSSE